VATRGGWFDTGQRGASPAQVLVVLLIAALVLLVVVVAVRRVT
jgi:hypothetical protein